MKNKRREVKGPKLKVNLRVGQEVLVIAGDDRGKTGKVLSVNRYKNLVQVSGIGLKTRYVKIDPNSQRSDKMQKLQESFVNVSNVKLMEEAK